MVAPAIRLVIVAGPDAGREFPVTGAIAIGRDVSAGIVLDDALVSRRHALVTADDGGALIDDLRSTNGTWVNDERVAAPRRVLLGDQIRIGRTLLALRPEALAATLGAPPAREGADGLKEEGRTCQP